MLSAPLMVLSSKVSVAARPPVPDGVKITPIEHVWPEYNDEPGVSMHVVVLGSTLKSAAFVPVSATFVRVIVLLPVFVTVTI